MGIDIWYDSDEETNQKTEASSHSAQGLFDLLDDFTNASGLKKKSKLLISGKNILRRLISSILDLEEGTKTYLPILVPQDLKRKRKKRKVKTIKIFPPPSPKALTKARSLWRQQLLKRPPAKTKKPVFGEGEDEPKRPRETLEERKKKKYSFRKENVRKIFNGALKNGLQLPKCKRPVESGKVDNP